VIYPSRRAVVALGIALAALAVGGCGKKGPIVAPERRLPLPPDAMSAVVAERAIVVSWSNPRVRVDGTRLRDVAVVRLFRREEAADAALKPAMLSGDRVVGYEEIVRIPLDVAPPAGVQVQGGTVSVTDSAGLNYGRRYVYVTTAEDGIGRSSPPSERLVVALLAGPAAPSGLDAQAGDTEVRLKWEAPGSFLDGTPASGELRYVVLRAAGDGALAPVTPAPIASTTFTDKGIENDIAYRYAVQAVRVDPAGTAKGAASTAVAATPVDTTPPSAPTRLIGIPASGSVRLAWNASPEEDVALYAVYRADGTGAFLRIATIQKITTAYTDRDVQSGRTYRYAVTALDRARQANESARSNEVSVTLP
jgi:fibronectin type 3 domain-containing protein/predicted small lipoprotein YifL